MNPSAPPSTQLGNPHEDAIQRYTRYRNSPWDFLVECVWTKDQADNGAVKPYPGELEYLRFITLCWQRERFLAIPKSRRMMMSWTMIPLALWDCIFHKGKSWAFVSKKEDDSGELVNRAEFVFNHIPESKIPRSLLPTIRGGKMTNSPPKLIFQFGDRHDKTQTESKIEGYPMGADQLRQFGFSGILGDECAFWEQGEEFYSAAQSTVQSVRSESGGGKIILISSRAPGFFKKVCYDRMDSKSSNFPALPPVKVKSPLHGVEIWKNPKNKFLVIDLHYSADPLKRTVEFREAIKASIPLYQYLREYEKSWETYEGLPVYPNFRSDIHVISDMEIKPHVGLPLLLGVDFGLSPAVVVTQLQGNSLKVLREFTTQNEGIKTFAPKVVTALKQYYPEWSLSQMHWYIDPAGFDRAQTDARTCAQEMEESAGIQNIYPGPVAFEPRRSSVEHFLLYIDHDGAGLELNESLCPLLRSGFAGGYRYNDKAIDLEPNKLAPLKDIHSHPHDALQYVAWGAKQHATNTTLIPIPKPSYGFAQATKQDPTPTRGTDYGREIKARKIIV